MKKLKAFWGNIFSLDNDNASQDEIYNRLVNGANFSGTNMCVLILAILIASIGLNMNSTAVIIRAMLISPLMGSIMAIEYGVASGDLTNFQLHLGVTGADHPDHLGYAEVK